MGQNQHLFANLSVLKRLKTLFHTTSQNQFNIILTLTYVRRFSKYFQNIKTNTNMFHFNGYYVAFKTKKRCYLVSNTPFIHQENENCWRKKTL